MKSILLSILLIGICVAPGCSTTPDRVMYQTVVVSRVSVQTALGIWNVWVGQGKANLEQERAVKGALDRYKAAMLLVCDAGEAFTAAPDQMSAQAKLEAAVTAATAARIDIINLLTSFGIKL